MPFLAEPSVTVGLGRQPARQARWSVWLNRP